MSDTHESSGFCGCFGLVLTILTIWAVFVGLPTPWGVLNVDLLPPAIHLDQATPNHPL